MIDFSTLQGLTIPEGVVTQIADASGRVLWKLSIAADEPAAILNVAKVTATTYAGETQYADEQFILLDVYPKKGGTVKVTYGGLTKTVKDTSGAEEPNAIQVFFGTFNGVSDTVATPASGTLTIEGAYRGYGRGVYQAYANKTPSNYASCITGAIDIGRPAYIGSSAFSGCTSLALTSLPDSVISIGSSAFDGCTSLALTSLPQGITAIQDYTFRDCYNINIREFPPNLISIGAEAFRIRSSLDSEITSHAMYNATITLPSTIESIGARAFCTDQDYLSGEGKYYTYILGVKVYATVPPTLGENAFGTSARTHSLGITGGRVQATVPTGCGEAYKAAAYWKSMNIVEGA